MSILMTTTSLRAVISVFVPDCTQEISFYPLILTFLSGKNLDTRVALILLDWRRIRLGFKDEVLGYNGDGF